MIAAMCRLYRLNGTTAYLDAARRADRFIWENMQEGGALFVSFRAGRRGVKGFLDDYSALLFAELALYEATLEQGYLDRAEQLCRKILDDFQDRDNGGFYLYGTDSEALIFRPKETYDGAIPSGNSLMAWNLVRLSQLLPSEIYRREAERQLTFLASEAAGYPAGYAMFLLALLDYEDPPVKATIVTPPRADTGRLPLTLPLGTVARLLVGPTAEYPLKDGKTTFYVCRGHSCLPPSNDFTM